MVSLTTFFLLSCNTFGLLLHKLHLPLRYLQSTHGIIVGGFINRDHMGGRARTSNRLLLANC